MHIHRNASVGGRYGSIVKNTAVSSQANILSKQASIYSDNTSPGVLGTFTTGPVLRMAMKPFSPLYQESNLMLPKDRKTMNAYNRHYFETDYWVGNALEIHTQLPLGGFRLVSRHKEIEKTFNALSRALDLPNLVLAVGLEYWVYGESFPFLEWDVENTTWQKATVFNPDLIEVRRTPLSSKAIISMIPDSELKRIAASTHPADQVLRSSISPRILDYVLKGESIPLNSRNVSHIVRKTVFHDIRGTSIIQRVWKELMLRDALREVLFVIAQNHITPLKIYRIGGKDKDYFPTDDELAYWQGVIEEAQNDPNFSIITHEAFDVEYKGFSGQIVDVTTYFKTIEEHVLQGLGVSRALISSEVTYANASVAYEILQKRYVHFRNMLESWLINKVFKPISIARGFRDKHGELLVPMIKWDNIAITKDNDWRSSLKEMNKAPNKLISDRTVITELGVDYDEEQELITREKIASIAKKKQIKELKDQADSGGMDALGGGMGDLGGLGGSMGGGGGGMGYLGGDMGGDMFSGAGAPPEGGTDTEFGTPPAQ